MRSTFSTMGLLTGLLLLGGCTTGTLAHYDLFSFVASDKGIIDHAVSLGSGKNCSAVRLEKGMRYCEEDEVEVKSNVHCYKTLGRVSCYEQEDPYHTNKPSMGNNDHNSANAQRN